MKHTKNLDGVAADRTESTLQRIVWSITWVIVWPVVVALASLVILLIVSRVFAHQPGMMMASFVALVICLCLFMIRRLSKDHSIVPRIGKKVLAGYTFFGVMALIAIIGFAFDGQVNQAASSEQNQQTAASVIVPQLARNAEIDSLLRQVGAPDTEIAKFSTEYVAGYSEAARAGEYTTYINPASGAYLYGKMSIKTNLESNQRLATVAHEYLHHVWSALLDESTKLRLTSDLITMYGNDSPARARAQSYSDMQRLQPTELFSIYCTESTDQYLSAYVRDECNKYINRNTFYMQR